MHGRPGNIHHRTTSRYRSARKLWIQVVMWGSKPRQWSLAIKGWWGTVSNAFLKSKVSHRPPCDFQVGVTSHVWTQSMQKLLILLVEIPTGNWRGMVFSNMSANYIKEIALKTLLIIGRSEIGLKSDEFWALGFFGMGTTEEVFRPDGGWPHRIEQLKRLVMEGAIAPAVCFI